MAKRFKIGNTVRVGKGRGIAQRYQGRTGEIVGSAGVTASGTQRFQVSMGTRRLLPLIVSETRLTFL